MALVLATAMYPVNSEGAVPSVVYTEHEANNEGKNSYICLISGFRREVDENCALLGHYAESSGNSLPTFRDNLSVPSSRVKLESISCPERSVRNYHSLLLNNPEESSSKKHLVLQMYIKYNVSVIFVWR